MKGLVSYITEYINKKSVESDYSLIKRIGLGMSMDDFESIILDLMPIFDIKKSNRSIEELYNNHWVGCIRQKMGRLYNFYITIKDWSGCFCVQFKDRAITKIDKCYNWFVNSNGQISTELLTINVDPIGDLKRYLKKLEIDE